MLEDLPTHPVVAHKREIRAWRAGLREIKDILLKASAADTGRSEAEGFLIEWGSVESALDYLEENVEAICGPHALKSSFKVWLGHRKLLQRRIPWGRVLVVGTWNYPLALHLVQILFAAAAGNRVVFKPSPHSPVLSALLEDHLTGVLGASRFEVWEPENEECLEKVRRGAFQLVLFTGGSEGAKAFAKACGEAMVPFIAEASGSEAAIVLPSRPAPKTLNGKVPNGKLTQSPQERAEEYVDHLLWAAFHYSGQTCVAPRFWFVPKSELDLYFNTTINLLESSPEVLESRIALKHASVKNEHETWQRWVADQAGVMQKRTHRRSEFCVFRVDSASNFPSDSPPTFGPGVAIVGYESVMDCVSWIRNSPWSLMTSVFGEPTRGDYASLDFLDASIVSLNEAVTSCGDAAIPFGGRGRSGFGVVHGAEGLMQLSRAQTWVEVHSWPGLAKLRPSWKRLMTLNQAGTWLKQLEERPLEVAKTWVSKNLLGGS